MLDANLPLGADVVVSGLGVIGQIVTRLLKRGGARTIIGVDGINLRRDLALKGGADHVLRPGEDKVAERVRELTEGRGADEIGKLWAAIERSIKAIRGTVSANGTMHKQAA